MIIKIWKLVVIVVCILILIYIGLQFFVLDKELKIVYNFKDRSERILGLEPWYRLTPIEETKDGATQYVKDSLVYFVAKLPPNFDQAEVMIKYKGLTEIKLGAEKAKDIYEFIETKNYEEEDWKIAKANFKIREIFLSNYLIENNRLRFAISAPGINEQSKMAISEIDIILKKSKLNKTDLQNLISRIKKNLFNRS